MRKLLFLILILFVSAPNLYSEYFYIKNYNTDIIVNKNSSAFIEEVINVYFTSPRHGIFRYIPLKNKNGKLRIKILNIKISFDNKNYRKINFRKYIEKDNIVLKIGSANRLYEGEVFYKILYKVENFVNNDKVLWNIIGAGWNVTIKNVEFSISYPPLESTDLISSEIYIAHQHNISKITNFSKYKDMIEFEGYGINLPPKTSISIKIIFPKGFFKKPSLFKYAYWFITDNWQFSITLIVFLICFTIWWYLGRDEKKGVIVVRYSPPKGVTPAEAGAIIDDTIDFKEVTATIFGLAEKGYLKIEKVITENMGNFFKKKSESIRFYKLKNIQPDLKEHEKIIFEGIFSFGGKQSSTDLLAEKFYMTIELFKDTLYNDITNHDKYFTMNPEEIKKLYHFIGKIVLFLSFFILVSGFATGSLNFKLPLSVFLSSIIIFIFGKIMPQKTFKGAKLYRELLGFKEFIKRVDEDKLKRMAVDEPKIFGKILPYAIALNLEKEWIKKFDALQIEPPEWYGGNFSGTRSLSNLMIDMAIIHTAISSMPKPSPISNIGDGSINPGGGFGGGIGGGFGGGGGGGGGSW